MNKLLAPLILLVGLVLATVSPVPVAAANEPELNAVAYGSGVFVAVGAGGMIKTSPDGVNWTTVPEANRPTQEDLHGIAYFPLGFVAVGDNGTILSSSDGRYWDVRSSGSTKHLLDVSSSHVGRLLITGEDGTLLQNSYANNPTGWYSALTPPLNGSSLKGVAHHLHSALAVGDNGEIFKYVSSDGTSGTWAPVSSTGASNFKAAAFTVNADSVNGKFVAVGDAGAIEYDNGSAFVAPASKDGVTQDLHDVAFGDTYSAKMIVAVGDAGTLLTSTDGGVNWTKRDSDTTKSIRSVMFARISGSGIGKFVAVGDKGTILTSFDGQLWENQTDAVPFSSTGKTSTTVSFGWPAADGATGLAIEQATAANPDWAPAATAAALTPDATSATVTGLSPNSGYYFRLIVTGGENAGTSNFVNIATDPQPIADFANTDKTSVTVSFSWTAPSGATSVAIERSPAGIGFWQPAATSVALTAGATTATVTGLSPNTAYDFRLVVTGGMNAGPSNTASVTTDPLPIVDFTVTNKASDTASFSWTAASGAAAVAIEQSLSGSGSWSAAATSAPLTPGAAAATVTGLNPNTAYDFRLVVTGGMNAGASNSTSVTTDPQPVADFAVTGKTSDTVSFSWTAASGATAVVIEQSLAGAGSWSAAATSAPLTPGAAASTVTGLNPATAYDFRLVVTGGMNAGASNTASVTTDSRPVADFAATGKTSDTVSLSWTAAIGATAVAIEQSLAGSGSWSAAVTSAPLTPGAAAATVTGLNPNTAYDFRLVVTGGMNAGASNTASITTDPQPVANFAVTGKTSTSASLGWTAVSGATVVAIEQSLAGSGSWGTAATSSPLTPAAGAATVTGLSPNTAYDFRLVVTGGMNAGTSNTASVTTAPQPVVSFAVTGKTSTSASFGWTAASSATAVAIEQSPAGDGNWSAAVTSAPLAPGAAAATVTGLQPETAYDFRLVVTGGANAGSSNTVNVTTNKSFEVDPIADQTLDALVQGYGSGTPTPKEVRIANSGTEPLSNLSVSLGGPNADAFVATNPTPSTLASGESATFTIRAKDGLTKGTYVATVSVNANHGTVATFTVTQLVADRKGDFNGDGVLTPADALIITQYLSGKITLTAEQIEQMDMNGDHVLDNEDVKLILAAYLGGS